MICKRCRKRAVINRLCREHFIRYFESAVEKTIRKYSLLRKKDRVCVATSGGKDSLSLLLVLKRLGYNVSALAIDEGIPHYREYSLNDLKKFCAKNSIPLKIAAFKEEFGKTLEEITKCKSKSPCTVCGTFRRYLLNKHSKGFDKIATGHNADDEAQTVLMNLFKSHTSLFFRGGPKTGIERRGFTQRVKPFYFMTEKEIKVYSLLNNLTDKFAECPHIKGAYRDDLRNELNRYEMQRPGTKRNILNHFIKLKRKHKPEGDINVCRECGNPCSTKVCKACELAEEIRSN